LAQRGAGEHDLAWVHREGWGGEVTINGGAVFKERGLKIAVELGIRVLNGKLKSL